MRSIASKGRLRLMQMLRGSRALPVDKNTDVQADVKTAAQALVNAVKLLRAGKLMQPDDDLHEARPK